jgi:serine/threonine protein kinase
MGTESNTPSNREEHLDEVIFNYLKKVEAGQTPDQKEILDRHPDLADDLARFFANRRRLNPFNTTLLPPVPAEPFAENDLPSFGDYEVLEKIPGGGMSVVYKARQRSLKRLVALKMILPDRAASPDDVQRIIHEAEDVAKLDHPNIVPIYEVNAHDGKPYFTMKYMEGGSLSARIKDFRLPGLDPRTRQDQDGKRWTSREIRKRQRAIAGLMATIARAVHHAHQRGILHRDLKPGNVLLDAAGKPHVTDFGLAKRFEAGKRPSLIESLASESTSPEHGDHAAAIQQKPKVGDTTVEYVASEVAALSTGQPARQSASGAVVGTPSYMAPEQASASKFLTTAADVYGLGAILYELLTGRPPFRAQTPLETLLEVIEKDPAPPRAVIPQIDSDLEAICLKCLRKDPQERYGNAEALADDFERFARNEPVMVRPVGKAQRLWRWCRRNPALAGSLGAGVGALLVGILVATVFGFKAEASADDANTNLITANNALNDLEDTNTKLREREEQLEKTLARSLLRPIGLGTPLPPGNTSILTNPRPAELPLTEPEIEALWELASNSGDQLWYRFAEEALAQPGTTRQLKNRSAHVWQAAVGLDPQKRQRLEEFVRKRLEERGMEEDQRVDLALAAADLGELTPQTARIVEEILLQSVDNAIGDNARGWFLMQFEEVFPKIVVRLESKDAAQAAFWMIHFMTERGGAYATYLVKSLSAVAVKLDAKDVAHAVETMTEAMGKITDIRVLVQNGIMCSCAECVSALSARLVAKDAAEAAARITETMRRMENSSIPQTVQVFLARALSTLAARLEPKAWASLLSNAMNATADLGALRELANGLSAVADRLDADDAWRCCADGRLVQAIGNPNIPQYPEPVRPALRAALAALATRLNAKDATQLSNTLAEAMCETTHPAALSALVDVLSAAATRLEPKDADLLVSRITRAIGDSTPPENLPALAQGLSAVATRLGTPDTARICGEFATRFIRLMEDTNKPNTSVEYFARAFLEVAVHLESKDAARCSRIAAILLVKSLNNPLDELSVDGLAEILSELAAHLEAEDAVQAATNLTIVICERKLAFRRPSLADALWVMLSRVEPEAAARIAADAATRFTEEMGKTTNSHELLGLVQGLSAVASRLDAITAARTADRLNLIIDDAKDPAFLTMNQYVLFHLFESMSILASRLEIKDAARVMDHLAHSLAGNPDLIAFALVSEEPLPEAMSAIAARLTAEDSTRYCAEVVALIRQKIRNAGGPYELPEMAKAMSVLAGHLDSKEAAECCAESARQFIKVIRRTRDDASHNRLAFALRAVAARLPPEDGASLLIQCMSEVGAGRYGFAKQVLAAGLRATLNRLDSEQATTTQFRGPFYRAVSTATCIIATQQPLSLTAKLALEKFPNPLPPQFLVNLLKQPTCISDARRVVLDVLQMHYHRPFVDQWDFVRFAQEQNLGLDLTSPPKRSTALENLR